MLQHRPSQASSSSKKKKRKKGEWDGRKKNQITWPSIIINSWWNGQSWTLSLPLLSSMHSSLIVDWLFMQIFLTSLVLFFLSSSFLSRLLPNKQTYTWKIKCCSCYLCYWAIYRHLFYFFVCLALLFLSFFLCVPFIVIVLYFRSPHSLPTIWWRLNEESKGTACLLACWCVRLNIYSLWKSSNKNAASRLILCT